MAIARQDLEDVPAGISGSAFAREQLDHELDLLELPYHLVRVDSVVEVTERNIGDISAQAYGAVIALGATVLIGRLCSVVGSCWTTRPQVTDAGPDSHPVLVLAPQLLSANVSLSSCVTAWSSTVQRRARSCKEPNCVCEYILHLFGCGGTRTVHLGRLHGSCAAAFLPQLGHQDCQ